MESLVFTINNMNKKLEKLYIMKKMKKQSPVAPV